MLLYVKTLYFAGSRKLRARYIGPFRVIERIERTVYRLDLKDRFKQIHNIFHVSYLKKCIPGDSSSTLSETIQVEGEDHLEVEALLKHRSWANSWQYLAIWLGYGTEHDEWVHEKGLANGAEAMLK